MAIEGQLQAVINPLVTGGCYPVKNTSKVITYPYVTYQKIYGKPQYTLDGPDGTCERRLYQFDVYAESYSEAKVKAKEITVAIDTALPQSVKTNDMDWPEDEIHISHVILEYSILSE